MEKLLPTCVKNNSDTRKDEYKWLIYSTKNSDQVGAIKTEFKSACNGAIVIIRFELKETK